MSNNKDLIVFQKADELAFKIYKETERFPKSELFGLTSQISAPEYRSFIADLKARVAVARLSARTVNRELILLYWDIVLEMRGVGH